MPPDRQFYEPEGGTALDEGNEVFDVTAWRKNPIETIDTAHKKIHIGKAFLAFHNDSNLGNNSNINIYFETSATQKIHIHVAAHGKFDFDFDFLEEPTVTGGDAKTVQNRDRNSDNSTSLINIKTNVVIADDGLIIDQDFMGQGQKVGGDTVFDNEWVLKTNSSYCLRFTSLANSNRAHIKLNWYEPS